MIRKNSRILIVGTLAFAAAAFAAATYFLFFKKQDVSPGGEGLSRFKVETIRSENGWGYRIRQDTLPVIEQRVIPGVTGTNGFMTEPEAAKTGALVKQKLDQGIFPPTVTRHELDSLGVKYQ